MPYDLWGEAEVYFPITFVLAPCWFSLHREDKKWLCQYCAIFRSNFSNAMEFLLRLYSEARGAFFLQVDIVCKAKTIIPAAEPCQAERKCSLLTSSVFATCLKQWWLAWYCPYSTGNGTRGRKECEKASGSACLDQDAARDAANGTVLAGSEAKDHGHKEKNQ